MFGFSPILLIVIIGVAAVGWLVVTFNRLVALTPGWRTHMHRSMCN